MRSRISSDLGHVLTEAVAASNGTDTATTGVASLAVIERALGQRNGAISARLAPHSSLTGDAAGGFDPDALITQLNTELFTDANDQGDGVYTVPAAMVCAADDTECASQIAQLQLRVRVESSGSELRFAIQVDADHDEPLVIALTHESLAASVSLDDAAHALTSVATVLGEQAPNAQLAGEVTAKLEILGTAHMRASLVIDHAIAIAYGDAGVDLAGPGALRFSSAAANVGSIELDGSAGVGAFALGIGATLLHVPTEAQGIDLDLPGATVQATLANGQPLQLAHISLGDRSTVLTEDGATKLTIDLNAADGRTLDATITPDAVAGTETLTVSPRLDLAIHQPSPAPGDGTMYNVTRVLLDGSLRTSEASDQVEVHTGAFSILTDPASFGFSATAGQCVTGEDVYDDTTFTSYTKWTVGTCQ